MSDQIMTIGELFSQTWSQYKQRALPLIVVILISSMIIGGLALIIALCSIFGGGILTHFLDKTTGIYIIGALLCVLILIALILAFWCQSAMLAIVVDENLGIIEAFQHGWELLWPLAWILTILSGILITGFFFGLLPGLLCLTWFSFSVFILFEEDKRGMESLLISREYVRGHGWNIFGKLMTIWILSAIAGLVPFLGQILSILFTPFLLLYLLIMYRDLKAIKGPIELSDHSGSIIFWWIITGIGMILPIALLIWVLSILFTGQHQPIMPPDWSTMHGTSL